MASAAREGDLLERAQTESWMMRPPFSDLGAAICHALKTIDVPSSKFRIVKCTLAFGHLYFQSRIPWLPVPESIVLTCSETVAFLLQHTRALGPGRIRVRDPNAMAEALVLVGFLVRTAFARSYAEMLDAFIKESVDANCRNLDTQDFVRFAEAVAKVYALADINDDEDPVSP